MFIFLLSIFGLAIALVLWAIITLSAKIDGECAGELFDYFNHCGGTGEKVSSTDNN